MGNANVFRKLKERYDRGNMSSSSSLQFATSISYSSYSSSTSSATTNDSDDNEIMVISSAGWPTSSSTTSSEPTIIVTPMIIDSSCNNNTNMIGNDSKDNSPSSSASSSPRSSSPSPQPSPTSLSSPSSSSSNMSISPLPSPVSISVLTSSTPRSSPSTPSTPLKSPSSSLLSPTSASTPKSGVPVLVKKPSRFSLTAAAIKRKISGPKKVEIPPWIPTSPELVLDEKGLHEVFDRFDVDHNGTLCMKELRSLLLELLEYCVAVEKVLLKQATTCQDGIAIDLANHSLIRLQSLQSSNRLIDSWTHDLYNQLDCNKDGRLDRSDFVRSFNQHLRLY